jgi:hypothetical protein
MMLNIHRIGSALTGRVRALMQIYYNIINNGNHYLLTHSQQVSGKTPLRCVCCFRCAHSLTHFLINSVTFIPCALAMFDSAINSGSVHRMLVRIPRYLSGGRCGLVAISFCGV